MDSDHPQSSDPRSSLVVVLVIVVIVVAFAEEDEFLHLAGRLVIVRMFPTPLA